MTAKWMEIFKDEIDQREEVARREEKIRTLDSLIQKGRITVSEAAEELKMSVEDFQAAVEPLKVTNLRH